MRSIEEINKERKELSEKIRVLEDKDDKLFRELREVEKQELKHFDHTYVKINENVLMYVREQKLRGDIVEFHGILIEIDDNTKYSPIECDEYQLRGKISFNIEGDATIRIPLEEFKEKTTGDYKEIVELTDGDFEDERKGISERLSTYTSLWTWLRMYITFSD